MLFYSKNKFEKLVDLVSFITRIYVCVILFYSKNKFEKLVHLVGFIIRIINRIQQQILSFQFYFPKKQILSRVTLCQAKNTFLFKERNNMTNQPLKVLWFSHRWLVTVYTCPFTSSDEVRNTYDKDK